MSADLFSPSSGVYKTGNFPAHTDTSLDSLAPPVTVDPLDVLRNQIIETWLPKFNEPDFDAVGWFKDMESRGFVTCKEYSAGRLRALEHMDRLNWKEAAHYENVLHRISLPLDPSRSFEKSGEGPIIFVRDDKRDALVVMNGNHRTGKILREEHNPDDYPAYVIEFNSIALFDKLAGFDLGWGTVYMNIEVEQGDRRNMP